MHADRRTDMTKVIVAFHSFANAPKKEVVLLKPLKTITSGYASQSFSSSLTEKTQCFRRKKRWMLNRKTFAVYCTDHMRYINAECRHFNVKPDGTHRNDWIYEALSAFKFQISKKKRQGRQRTHTR